MVLGAPVVSDVIILMPADAAVGSVDDLEADEFRHVFWVERDVSEKSVVGSFGFGNESFSGVVTVDFVCGAGGFSSFGCLIKFTLENVHRAELCGEPRPIDGFLVSACGFFCGENVLFPGGKLFFVDGRGVKLLSYFINFLGELVFASDVGGFVVKVVKRDATVSGFVNAGFGQVVEECGE